VATCMRHMMDLCCCAYFVKLLFAFALLCVSPVGKLCVLLKIRTNPNEGRANYILTN